MSFFGKLKGALKSFFTSAQKHVAEFIAPLAYNIAVNGGQVLINAALAAVAAAEAQGGSGKDKFNAAFAKVEDELKSKGIPVVTSAINSALEAAVAKLRSGL